MFGVLQDNDGFVQETCATTLEETPRDVPVAAREEEASVSGDADSGADEAEEPKTTQGDQVHKHHTRITSFSAH